MSIFWIVIIVLELIAFATLQVYLLLRYIYVSDSLKKWMWRSSGEGKRRMLPGRLELGKR